MMTEAGKNGVVSIAGSVVSGLKTSPVLLAMLALNIVGIGAALYFLIKFGEANAARFATILDRCLPGST